MRQIEAELLLGRVDAEVRRETSEKRVEAVRRYHSAGLFHGRRKAGLETFPLRGERVRPVPLQQVGEARRERPRILESKSREFGASAFLRGALDDAHPHDLGFELLRIPHALVVVERSCELESGKPRAPCSAHARARRRSSRSRRWQADRQNRGRAPSRRTRNRRSRASDRRANVAFAESKGAAAHGAWDGRGRAG